MHTESTQFTVCSWTTAGNLPPALYYAVRALTSVLSCYDTHTHTPYSLSLIPFTTPFQRFSNEQLAPCSTCTRSDFHAGRAVCPLGSAFLN
jgi:hypothetical protein